MATRDLQPRVQWAPKSIHKGDFIGWRRTWSYVLSAGEWVGGSLYSARMPLEVHDENIEESNYRPSQEASSGPSDH